MTDFTILSNAFQPATELQDPERFAGRSKQIRELATSLHTVGATPLIYGDRGLGKSSLAVQLQLIAMGNVELLSELGADRLALPSGQEYLTFFTTCTDAIKTFDDILQMLVNSAESVDNVPTTQGAHQLVDRSTRKKVTLKIVELESTKTYQTESQRLSYQDLNMEEKLVQLCELLTATYNMPVLFIVDELDRVGNTRGLASFLKAASGPTLKFVLVGIASSVAGLLADHQSLERHLQPVRVPVMNPRELGQIVVKAQSYLEENGVRIGFSKAAVTCLTRVASGFPWFVHVLGRQALIDADGEGRSEIEESHVQRVIGLIVENQFAQQFADMYQMAVRDSELRERTLRAFAGWHDADIPTGEVYKLLRTELGVKGGSTYRGNLCQPEFGSILFAPQFQKRGLVRFRNEMFKAYVRLRPSIYADVDVDVMRAWRKHDRSP
ncbi:MAG: hypothetical protein ACR2N4_12815 [Jatrophihabitans sp.]